MSEIRCPACGKENQPGSKICRHCQAPLKPAAGGSSPFKDADSIEPAAELPDWLRELGVTDTAVHTSVQEAGGIAEGKAQEGGVPDRPAEQISPVQAEPPAVSSADVTDEEGIPETVPGLEEVGPLAGLTGLLTVDEGISHLSGQATRPLHLKITANQRLHADLLRSLVEAEGQPSPLPKRAGLITQRTQRWVIAAVIFLAVLWPLLTNRNPVVLDTYAEEVSELNRLVSQLPPEAKVLVAFDYEPAFAAEVEAAATPVLDHLMLRGAYLTFVSTTPIGPVLAERIMTGALADHEYTREDQYINLGYIPGGAAGLLSLVADPKRTVPYTIEGVEAWETAENPALPPLQGVHSFEDFSLALILVDDPDLARVWIEQVSPRQASQPEWTALTMVASAQSEAMLQPYYQSDPRQLHGFAAGLRGGAAYARMTGREGALQDYWGAFGTGLFVIAVVLVVGAVLHASTLPSQAATEGKSEVGP